MSEFNQTETEIFSVIYDGMCDLVETTWKSNTVRRYAPIAEAAEDLVRVLRGQGYLKSDVSLEKEEVEPDFTPDPYRTITFRDGSWGDYPANCVIEESNDKRWLNVFDSDKELIATYAIDGVISIRLVKGV